LIIGDSISIGYTLPIREMLKGIANVCRPNANCGNTARGLQYLDQWLGSTSWQVIHFNFGLHDLKCLKDGKLVSAAEGGVQQASPEVYEKNLRELVVHLKSKTAAKLIWASTTPVPDNSPGRVKGDEVIYNQVAERVMKENGILIDDLWSVVTPNFSELEYKPGNVHYKDKGYQLMAAAAVEKIKSVLPPPK
jgi:acyl-CoA thioesterase-1